MWEGASCARQAAGFEPLHADGGPGELRTRAPLHEQRHELTDRAGLEVLLGIADASLDFARG